MITDEIFSCQCCLRLSQQKLAELIQQHYQLKVDRHALKRNLQNLIEFGYDIEYTETVRRKKNGVDEVLYSNWYLNREISDTELHMLIDSMLFSKYIPFGQNIELVTKLKGLSSKIFRSKRKVPQGRLENQQILLTIEVLNEAFANGDKVTFQFIEYGVDSKHHVVSEKDGAPRVYKVSPYEIVVTNGRYYLICAHNKGDSLYNYRLEYMCALERVEDEKIRPLNEISGYEYGLDLSKYLEEHIYMYGGKKGEITVGKTDQIREILLMPICCDKKQDKIAREDNKILSGQKYYSSADADMSDFAVGFYEIVYKDILNSKPLLEYNSFLWNTEYAGDTMNSFNTVANIIPGAGKSREQRTAKEVWPEYLRNYHSKYHCLANFWILPMEIGRTTKGTLNKAINPIGDYMDRFLDMVHSEIRFDENDREYFRNFKSWDEFTCKHFLVNSYLDKELKIDLYSNSNEDRSQYFIKKALEKIEQRAECIAKSEYANELWKYFSECHFFKEKMRSNSYLSLNH